MYSVADLGVGAVGPDYQAMVHKTVTSGTVGARDIAVPLTRSNEVGPNQNTPNGSFALLYSVSTMFGPYGAWTTDGYTAAVGFSFARESDAQWLYGWVEVERLTWSTGRVLDWAYEDSGEPIHVGDTGEEPVAEPGSLALLALGAAGVAAMRRKRS